VHTQAIRWEWNNIAIREINSNAACAAKEKTMRLRVVLKYAPIVLWGYTPHIAVDGRMRIILQYSHKYIVVRYPTLYMKYGGGIKTKERCKGAMEQ
jgi:hypothetical protein